MQNRLISVLKPSFSMFFRDPHWVPKSINFLFTLLSLFFVFLGFFRPWYALPQLDPDTGAFFTIDSSFSLIFKGLLLIVILISIGYLLKRRLSSSIRNHTEHWLLRLISANLILTLFFPTALTLWDTKTIGEGAWLQQQHDTMTWLGGDVYRSHSERSISLGTGVNAQDPPERLAIFRPPTQSLSIDRLNDWIWWAGYGPSFTQFAGSGWFFTVFGYFLGSVCLIGHYWRQHIPSARILLRSIILQSLFGGAFLLALIVSLFASVRYLLHDAEEATANGAYAQARKSLQSALILIPSLRNDSGIIRQLGYFDLKTNRSHTPEAQLYQLFTYENNGYHGRAQKILNELTMQANHSLPSYCARELSRHQIRMAVNALNSSKNNAALLLFSQVIEKNPHCIQAYFHTQLASLLAGNLSKNRLSNKRLARLYQGFKSKNKRGVLATSYWVLAQGEFHAGFPQKAWEARLKSKGW